MSTYYFSVDPTFNTIANRSFLLSQLGIDPELSLYGPTDVEEVNTHTISIDFTNPIDYGDYYFSLLTKIVNINFNSQTPDENPDRAVAASTIPTSSHDESLNFGIGSYWIVTSTEEEYICVDDTIGAAIWRPNPSLSFTGVGTGQVGDTQPFEGSIIQYDDTSKLWITQPGKWSSYTVSALNMKLRGTNDPTFSVLIDGVYAYSFAPSVINELYFNIILPNQYEEDSDILPVLHYATNGTNGGDIVWGIEYTLQTPGSVYNNTSTITVINTASTNNLQHTTATFGSISGAGIEIGSILVGRIFRDGTNINDTYPDPAQLLYLDFQIQQIGTGSTQASLK